MQILVGDLRGNLGFGSKCVVRLQNKTSLCSFLCTFFLSTTHFLRTFLLPTTQVADPTTHCIPFGIGKKTLGKKNFTSQL